MQKYRFYITKSHPYKMMLDRKYKTSLSKFLINLLKFDFFYISVHLVDPIIILSHQFWWAFALIFMIINF